MRYKFYDVFADFTVNAEEDELCFCFSNGGIYRFAETWGIFGVAVKEYNIFISANSLLIREDFLDLATLQLNRFITQIKTTKGLLQRCP